MNYSKLFRSGIWVIISRILATGIGFGIHVVLARLLSVEQLGAYFIIISVMGFFVVLSQFGLLFLMSKKIAGYHVTKEEHEIWPVFIKVLSFLIINGFLIAMLLYIFIGKAIFHDLFNLDIDSLVIFYISLNIIAASLVSLMQACYRGFNYIFLSLAFCELLVNILFFLILVIHFFSAKDVDMKDIFLYWFLSRIISMLIAAIFLNKILYPGLADSKSESLLDLLAAGTPIAISGIISLISSTSLVWLIGFIFDSATVAIHGIAVRVVLFTLLVNAAFTYVMQPALARYYKLGNLESIQSLLQLAASVCSMFLIISFILMGLYGETIFILLFGYEYVESYGLLMIMLLFYAINSYIGFSGMLLFTANYATTMMITMLVAFVIRISLAILLAEEMKVYGIVLAWFIGDILENAWCWYKAKSLMNIKCHASYGYMRKAYLKIKLYVLGIS